MVKLGGVVFKEAIDAQHRRAMMLFAPRTVQNVPEAFRRYPMMASQPASMTPEPTKSPLARNSGSHPAGVCFKVVSFGSETKRRRLQPSLPTRRPGSFAHAEKHAALTLPDVTELQPSAGRNQRAQEFCGRYLPLVPKPLSSLSGKTQSTFPNRPSPVRASTNRSKSTDGS